MYSVLCPLKVLSLTPFRVSFVGMLGSLPITSFLTGNYHLLRASTLRGTATVMCSNTENPFGFKWHRSMIRSKVKHTCCSILLRVLLLYCCCCLLLYSDRHRVHNRQQPYYILLVVVVLLECICVDSVPCDTGSNATLYSVCSMIVEKRTLLHTSIVMP